jgi:hypothetical protein
MPLLDLLGTVTGVAFLAGAIALALRVDRREAARRVRHRDQLGPLASSGPPSDAGRLRLVAGAGR